MDVGRMSLDLLTLHFHCTHLLINFGKVVLLCLTFATLGLRSCTTCS